MNIEDRVREILSEVIGKEISLLSTKQKLVEIGVSSMAMIQLIVLLEEEFECRVPVNRLNLYELDSLENVVKVFERCIKGKEDDRSNRYQGD